MGLFTKQQLTDAERQAWSAQLLEVRTAEFDHFGASPTLGDNWDTHDQEWNRLYAQEYLPRYGILAGSEMHADGLRLSGYRRFVFGELGGMIVLASEITDAPADWKAGEVYWIANTGEFDEDGDQIYGYQFISSSWKYAKSHMRERVKDWDLINQRLGLGLANWNKYFKIVAAAILGILIVISLVPIIGGLALGAALGETILVTGSGGLLEALAGAAVGASAAYAALNLDRIEGFLEKHVVGSDPMYSDVDSQFGSENLVPVFEGNTLHFEDNAPANPPALASGDSFFAILAVAAGFLLFL